MHAGKSPVVIIADSIWDADQDNPISCRVICEDVTVVHHVPFADMEHLQRSLLAWPKYNRGRHYAVSTLRLREDVKKGRIK